MGSESVGVREPGPELVELPLELNQPGEVIGLKIRWDVRSREQCEPGEILRAPRPGERGIRQNTASEQVPLYGPGHEGGPQARAGRAQIHAFPATILQADARDLEHVGGHGERQVRRLAEGPGVVVGGADVVHAADDGSTKQ